MFASSVVQHVAYQRSGADLSTKHEDSGQITGAANGGQHTNSPKCGRGCRITGNGSVVNGNVPAGNLQPLTRLVLCLAVGDVDNVRRVSNATAVSLLDNVCRLGRGRNLPDFCGESKRVVHAGVELLNRIG